MNRKHQANCYRVIKGQKLENYADLIMGDEENQQVIDEAKLAYKIVRKIKHPDGYHQLFVGGNKPIIIELINVGTSNICKRIAVKDMVPTFHDEISKILNSKKWQMHEIEPREFEISIDDQVVGAFQIISK